MPAVNESLVREYLESLGFLVRQPHKYLVQARAKRPEEEVDFVAWNPGAEERAAPAPGIWTGQELRGVARVVVSVRGWHTERFGPAMLADAPEIFRFVDPEAMRLARRLLGDGQPARVLCVPALPVAKPARDRALAMFRERGVDGVLLFRTLLLELVARVDPKANYEKSDVLQILRILKRYRLLRDAQMELFAGPRRSRAAGNPRAPRRPKAAPKPGDAPAGGGE